MFYLETDQRIVSGKENIGELNRQYSLNVIHTRPNLLEHNSFPYSRIAGY